MRDAAGKLTNGVDLLRLEELRQRDLAFPGALLDPMLQLLIEVLEPLFGALAFGYVVGNAAQPDGPAGLIESWRRARDTPAQLSVRTLDAKLAVIGLARHRGPGGGGVEPLAVIGMDQRPDALARRHERLWLNPENAVLPLVPELFAGDEVVIIRAHAARREGEAAPLLALPQTCRRGFELGGSLGDTLFELDIEPFQIPGLAIEFGEDLDLRPQHLGNDRDWDVIDRPRLVAAQAVEIGNLDGRHEDDRNLLEARVVADHGGELEAIELRHRDVEQDEGDIHLQQLLKRLPRGTRLDQVLAQLTQNDLIAEQLGRLIIHEEDVDPILALRVHDGAVPVCHRCSHMRSAESNCSVLTGFAR